MTRRNDLTILTAAYTFRAEFASGEATLLGLRFPIAWHQALAALQELALGRVGRPVSVPIWSLNSALRALVPYLIAAPRDIRSSDLHPSGSGDDVPGSGPYWLIARHEIPAEKLWLVVQAWIEQTFRNLPTNAATALSDARKAVRAEDLRWEPVSLLFSSPTAPNGTARPNPLAYSVLPALLAERLVARNLRIRVGGVPCPVQWTPRLGGGVELITWPPAYATDRRGPHGYSYVIALTLQTIPGIAVPRLYAHYGVRRWRSTPTVAEDGSSRVPARWAKTYLRSTQGWLGLPSTGMFALAELGSMMADDQRVPAWRNGVPDIARRLGIEFPPAVQLAADPYLWLRGVHGVEAGLVEMQPRNHPVGAGIGLDDVEAMTEAVGEALNGEVEQCPPLVALKGHSNRSAHPLQRNLRDLTPETRLAALGESVACLGNRPGDVTIEVWWEHEAVRDMLVDRIIATLTRPRPELVDLVPTSKQEQEEDRGGPNAGDGLLSDGMLADEETALIDETADAIIPAYEDDDEQLGEDADEAGVANEEPALADSGKVQRAARPRVRAEEPQPAPAAGPIEPLPLPGGGQLLIVPRRLGDIGAPLPPPSGTGHSFIRRTVERATQIHADVSAATGPTLALIELPNYRDPNKKQLRREFGRRDPKIALRLGMASVGRVSQFIAPSDADQEAQSPDDAMKTLRQRANGAVLDGLRQLGYLPASIGFQFSSGPQLPGDLLVAAVHMVRLTRKRALSRVYVPVVVLMHTARRAVYAWLPGGEGREGGVRTYHQALLDLAQLNPDLVTRARRDDLLQQLRTFLTRDLPRQGGRNAVILVTAQNARDIWPGLTNDRLTWESIRFDRGDGPTAPVNGAPGNPRLIRLRTYEYNETPEWYLPHSAPGSSAGGLWRDRSTSRVFFCTAPKLLSMKGRRHGKQVSPQEQYALASLLEIVPIAVQASDRDDDGGASIWAHAIEQWRKMSYLATTGASTLLPLPLRFAEKMDEYAEVITAQAYPDDYETDDDDDDSDPSDADAQGIIQLTLLT